MNAPENNPIYSAHIFWYSNDPFKFSTDVMNFRSAPFGRLNTIMVITAATAARPNENKVNMVGFIMKFDCRITEDIIINNQIAETNTICKAEGYRNLKNPLSFCRAPAIGLYNFFLISSVIFSNPGLPSNANIFFLYASTPG